MCLPCRSSYSGTSKCPSGAVWLGDSRALLGCTSESGLMLALQQCSHSASAVLAELTGLMMPLGILVLGLGTWSPASGMIALLSPDTLHALSLNHFCSLCVPTFFLGPSLGPFISLGHKGPFKVWAEVSRS